MSKLLARILAPTASSNPNEEHLRTLLGLLSPIQRKFLLDKRRQKIARCTRRAGKTFVDAVYLIYECLQNPKTPVLYAGLTRDSAKEAIWDILLTVLEDLGIPHEARPSTLMVEFPNGSKITIFGCDAQNARNRLRGRKFKLIIFDETGFYAAVDPLVYVVMPMLADFGGTLCLTSSPGELLSGLFYEADQGKKKEKWSQYFWTIHDNPFFQGPALDGSPRTRAQEEVQNVLENQYFGNAQHPDYRREWLGEWVADSTSLVYPATGVNILEHTYRMPHQMQIIGINIGAPFHHSCVVGRFSEYAREFQIIDQWTRADLDIDSFAALVNLEIERHQPVAIVAFVGNYTKHVGDELRRRYHWPIVIAETRDLSFHQKVFSTDLQQGHIKVRAGLPLLAEYGKIVKGPEGEEIVGQENYGANAALVAYRRVYQTVLATFEPPVPSEERIIQQLEQSRYVEEPLWYDRVS